MKNGFRNILIHYKVLLFFIPLIVFIYFLISYLSIFFHNTDYPVHINAAISLWNGDNIPISILNHPIYQFLIILLSGFSIQNFFFAGVIVNVLIAEFLFLIIFHTIKHVGVNPLPSGFLAFGIIISTPIILLTSKDGLNYLGYIGLAVYHNPTIFLLKPFSLLCFIYVLKLFTYNELKTSEVILAALVSATSALIKPNFAICFLPAICLFGFFLILKKRKYNLMQFQLGFIFPAVVVLIWQYFSTYGDNAGGIIFAPFAVYRYYSNFLILKLLFSIWFPLLVSVIFFGKIFRSDRMILSWLIFFFGFIYTYLLAEEVRFHSGNFGWSGEIALFILFVNTIIFLFEQKNQSQINKIATVPLLIIGFLPHVVAGIYYYIQCLVFGNYG